jgi:hypothetical protein
MPLTLNIYQISKVASNLSPSDHAFIHKLDEHTDNFSWRMIILLSLPVCEA